MSNHADPLAAANGSRDLLLAAIGPTCGFHVSELPAGGFVVIVDGKFHAACTDGWEAKDILGRVMASHFARSFTRPDDARDVTDDVRDEPMPDGGPRLVRPQQMARREDKPEASVVERAHATAVVAMLALCVVVRGVVGV